MHVVGPLGSQPGTGAAILFSLVPRAGQGESVACRSPIAADVNGTVHMPLLGAPTRVN